jgi:hypothetical protein
MSGDMKPCNFCNLNIPTGATRTQCLANYIDGGASAGAYTLNSMTKKQLLERCKTLGIKGVTGLRKAELVAVLSANNQKGKSRR